MLKLRLFALWASAASLCSLAPTVESIKMKKECVSIKLPSFPITRGPPRAAASANSSSMGTLAVLAATDPDAYAQGRHPISSAFDISPGLAQCGYDDPKCLTDYWQRRCATSSAPDDRAVTPNVTVIEAESYWWCGCKVASRYAMQINNYKNYKVRALAPAVAPSCSCSGRSPRRLAKCGRLHTSFVLPLARPSSSCPASR